MSNTYTATIKFDGQTHTLTVADDQTVLAAAQAAGVDLPYSCSAGVCTTCAAKLISGTVDQSEAMGLSPELQAEGYALLCVARPQSDLVVEPGKENEVYDRQFGQS